MILHLYRYSSHRVCGWLDPGLETTLQRCLILINNQQTKCTATVNEIMIWHESPSALQHEFFEVRCTHVQTYTGHCTLPHVVDHL